MFDTLSTNIAAYSPETDAHQEMENTYPPNLDLKRLKLIPQLGETTG
jgi:hypothetical protein